VSAYLGDPLPKKRGWRDDKSGLYCQRGSAAMEQRSDALTATSDTCSSARSSQMVFLSKAACSAATHSETFGKSRSGGPVKRSMTGTDLFALDSLRPCVGLADVSAWSRAEAISRGANARGVESGWR